MRLVEHRFGPVTLRAPPAWMEITENVGPGAPFTLARAGGRGALQLSLGRPSDGRAVNPDPAHLLRMVHEIASQRGLASPFDERVELGAPLRAASSFRAEEAFVRVWVLAAHGHVLACTYVCDWEQRDVEAADCELIIAGARLQ